MANVNDKVVVRNNNSIRFLSAHKVDGDMNPQVGIAVMDKPGQGGAHHEYIIFDEKRFNRSKSAGQNDYHAANESVIGRISFQNGPVLEFGINGVTHEALLAVISDRLESFQAGKFASKHNAMALEHNNDTMSELQARTKDRVARNVEGKNEK